MQRYLFTIALLVAAGCGDVDDEAGPPGPQGPSGEQGPIGETGASGATGPAGQSVSVEPEPPGDNCASGGFKLIAASGTTYLCNGADAIAPIGSVVAFAGGQPPPGWLLCDGTAVSRTTYAALFATIGTTWGEGDAATTFNLPDMRGRFLRGTDHGAGHDPDANSRTASLGGGNIGDRVGTLQGHQFERHTHGYAGAFTQDGSVIGGHIQGGTSTPYTVWGYGSNTGVAGGNETRPANVSVNYIIKF